MCLRSNPWLLYREKGRKDVGELGLLISTGYRLNCLMIEGKSQSKSHFKPIEYYKKRKTLKSEMELPSHLSHQHTHGTCSQPQLPFPHPTYPKHSQEVNTSQFSTSFPPADNEEEESVPDLSLIAVKEPLSPISVSSSINGLFLRSEAGSEIVSILERSIEEDAKEVPVKLISPVESKGRQATIFLIGILVIGVLCAYFCRKLLRAVS